jgi:hypothetical protein
MPESQFGQTKPSYKSLSCYKWFYAPLVSCPFKIQKEKRAGLHFKTTGYLSFVLAPLRIHWTIPLINYSFFPLSFYTNLLLCVVVADIKVLSVVKSRNFYILFYLFTGSYSIIFGHKSLSHARLSDPPYF